MLNNIFINLLQFGIYITCQMENLEFLYRYVNQMSRHIVVYEIRPKIDFRLLLFLFFNEGCETSGRKQKVRLPHVR